ncbi:MAG: GntR family transcriptional regulator [Nitrosospira sp.]
MTSSLTLVPSPLPLYTQIKDILRERILEGTYKAHQKLPSESEMSALFDVSRITVRQALSDLQNEGLIFRIPGKGTFVAKPKAFQQLTQLEGFAEAMLRMGYEIYNKVISHKSVPASAIVAKKLKLETGTSVSEIRRVRYLNREPLSMEVTYIIEDIGERLRNFDLPTRDIFLVLENDFGIALGHADLQIDAMLADDDLAHQLKIEGGSAVLRMERLTHTTAGKPLDFEYLYFRGDAFQYRLQIARRAVDATATPQNQISDPPR